MLAPEVLEVLGYWFRILRLLRLLGRGGDLEPLEVLKSKEVWITTDFYRLCDWGPHLDCPECFKVSGCVKMS